MNITLLGVKVPESFLREVRVQAAQRGDNVSEFLRKLVARELGFSSFEEGVHITSQRYAPQTDQPLEPAA